MRAMIEFSCEGDTLLATLDAADGTTGLLIVSGGNEIRSGAYAGQAAMAEHFAALGFPVFRYDRRGIGESEGTNGGFESSANDIAAALMAFQHAAPQISRIVAFGNCDAASSLALFHNGLAITGLLLANPWVIDAAETPAKEDAPNSSSTPNVPSAAAIRARYWNRLKNPRSLIDLLTGKVDLRKLAGGLAKAAAKQEASSLAIQIADQLAKTQIAVRILIAQRDTTALAFIAAWRDAAFKGVRDNPNVTMTATDSASHSFADAAAKAWLYSQIEAELKREL
jgi:exosortase A-associated hydrolase 1